nr:hypothetical protein [Tanacetum cinerariifolium]
MGNHGIAKWVLEGGDNRTRLGCLVASGIGRVWGSRLAENGMNMVEGINRLAASVRITGWGSSVDIGFGSACSTVGVGTESIVSVKIVSNTKFFFLEKFSKKLDAVFYQGVYLVAEACKRNGSRSVTYDCFKAIT